MSTPTSEEIALQAEIRRLQARVAELEAARQIPGEIIEKSPVMINIMRAPDFTYELVNPAFQRLAPGKQFLGRRFADVWAEVSEPLVEILRNVIETERPFELEDAPYTIQRGPDAPPEVVHVTYSWIPLSGPEGKPDRILTLAYETTGSVRQREALRLLARELEERVGELQTVLDAAPVAIWIAHDPQCLEITGNRMADRFYEAGVGENVSANITGARRFLQSGRELEPRELPMQEAAARGIDVRNSELEVLLPSGRVLSMLGNASPLRDAAGNVRGCVGTFLDITDRKRAEEALRESEAVLRGLFDSPDVIRGIVELNAGRIVHVSCNQAAAEMYGVRVEEIAGKSATDAGAPEEVAQVWVALYEKSRVTGQPVSMEYSRKDARGRDRWLLATAFFLGASQAGLPRFAYTVLDLTERKRAEEALRESEGRLTFALGITGTGAWDLDLIDHTANRSLAHDRIFGYEALLPQWTFEMFLEHVLPEDREEVARKFGHATETGTDWNFECRIRRADGEIRWIWAAGRHVRGLDGEIRRMAGVVQDVTERKLAEESLRASEQQFRTLANVIPQLCWMANADGWLFWYNDRWYAYTGTRPEQMEGWGWQSVHDPEALPAVMDRWKASIAAGIPFEMVFPLRGADGVFRPFLTRAVPLRDSEGKVVRWIGTNTDIGEQRRIEEALRESEFHAHRRLAEIEAIYEYSPVGLCVLDTQLRFVRVNRRFAEMNGLTAEAHIGKTPRELTPGLAQAAEDAMRRVLESGEPLLNFEASGATAAQPGVQRTWNQNWFPLRDSTGAIIGLSVAAEETTDRKRAEERLREAQKLESLGLLAGGVAHDFNNLLVGVVGNASLAQEMLPPDHAVSELLDGVLKAGEQAAHLTRQMLAYSGKGKFVTELLDLPALIPEITGLVRPSIPKKIALNLELAEETPRIEADRGQIQQVFMNLALNAAEAIGSAEGRITVRTGVRDVDEAYRQSHPEAAALPAGEYVYLRVDDTGCGMDAGTKARIFDPFFSTKFIGRGLGLAAVAGIVRGHRGAIAVASAPGRGSSFTVLFPAAGRAADEPVTGARDARFRGAGTILVVDDEDMVRQMVGRSLERHGYTVLLADSGLAAVDLFRRHPGEIALVILDLSMPGMSGEEALPELRKIRPRAKVVISSGYGESEAMTIFTGQRVSGFIQKPYTSKRIAEKVKACLADS
jgi:two-component system, cell cycle sensor histidine kinase and response regulator CckA